MTVTTHKEAKHKARTRPMSLEEAALSLTQGGRLWLLPTPAGEALSRALQDPAWQLPEGVGPTRARPGMLERIERTPHGTLLSDVDGRAWLSVPSQKAGSREGESSKAGSIEVNLEFYVGTTWSGEGGEWVLESVRTVVHRHGNEIEIGDDDIAAAQELIAARYDQNNLAFVAYAGWNVDEV